MSMSHRKAALAVLTAAGCALAQAQGMPPNPYAPIQPAAAPSGATAPSAGAMPALDPRQPNTVQPSATPAPSRASSYAPASHDGRQFVLSTIDRGVALVEARRGGMTEELMELRHGETSLIDGDEFHVSIVGNGFSGKVQLRQVDRKGKPGRLVREIGFQLSFGGMKPTGVGAAPAYR